MSDSLDLSKISQRDKALVTILERMLKQLYVQDTLIKELAGRHDNIKGTIEDSVFQSNLNRDEVDSGLKKLHDSFSRYRSDMLSFVHEQDLIRTSMDTALESVKKIAYDVENSEQVVLKIETEVEKQKDMLSENIVFTNRKWEDLPQEFNDVSRKILELHANIDSYFAQLSKETEKHFKKVQVETARRLRILDDMMNALDTLLIRTAPPDKKPFVFIRVFKVIGRFFKKTAIRFIGSFSSKKQPESFKNSDIDDNN